MFLAFLLQLSDKYVWRQPCLRLFPFDDFPVRIPNFFRGGSHDMWTSNFEVRLEVRSWALGDWTFVTEYIHFTRIIFSPWRAFCRTPLHSHQEVTSTPEQSLPCHFLRWRVCLFLFIFITREQVTLHIQPAELSLILEPSLTPCCCVFGNRYET